MVERKKYQISNVKVNTWDQFAKLAKSLGVSQAYLFEKMLNNYNHKHYNEE